MTQVDIARVALGAPALQQVFVVSRPECLLIKSWARNERSNTEDAAALIGNLFRDCDDALVSVGGGSEPRTLMVESNDRVLVVSRVAEDMAAAFVFEQSAPLGLIRVQARQLTAQLARTLASNPSRSSAPSQAATRRPGADRLSQERGVHPAMSERSPAFGIPPANPTARPPSTARRAPEPGPRPVNDRPPTPSPRAAMSERSPAFGIPPVNPAARTPPPPRVVRDERGTPHPHINERPAANEAPGAHNEQLVARIAAFAKGASDARSALLRLSLRTGLPMELLERASTLSQNQADLVNRALDELQKSTTPPAP